MVVAQGAKGDQGNQGTQGTQGERGYQGYQGNQGITGAVGQGVESVTEEYAISTSKTTQPTTGWSITQPTWSQGQYIWSRVKVVYKNPSSTIYTGYAVSSEWEAVNNLEIGGRNLLSYSSDIWEPGHILSTDGTNSTISRTRTKGFLSFSSSTEYTFSRGTDLFERCMVFEYDENYNFIVVNSGEGTWMPNSKKFTFTTKTNTRYLRFVLDIPFNANNIPNYEIQLEKGNKATDWTPAPEDVQAEIDSAVVKATYWSVKASSPVIYKDAINAATSGTHTPVTISGELRSGTTTTSGGFITVTPNGGTEAGTATASPVTIAPANGDGKTSYTVRLYDTASKTTLLDTQTIPVVFKGNQGNQGYQGYQGNQGTQGLKGDKGDQGDQGYQGVSGSPPANNTVTYAKIGTDLKNSSAISASDVNWNASGIFTKTLSANTTFTFSNLRLNKVITLVLNGNYAVTMPSEVKIISGEYDGSTTNYIQLHCTNTAIPVVWCVISQEAV